MESLRNSFDNSIALLAMPPQSTTPPGAPIPLLDIDYNSSTTSEAVHSSPSSSVMKLAPRSHSPGPSYFSDPETLPSYFPVPEVREYVFCPRIVFYDSTNKTTNELTFKSFNAANTDIESRAIPINGRGNKS